MSCAWGGEKEDDGDHCGKRPGFRSPSVEGPLGLSLSPSGGTGLEYRLGREQDEKGRETVKAWKAHSLSLPRSW